MWYLLELTHRDDLSFVLLSLNQEKTFDRVDHRYPTGMLRVFSFSPHFMRFLQVLYASAECIININLMLVEPIPLSQGVCPGCLL